VTSVHRTIFDLAASVSVDEVVAMMKEAEYLNLWDRLSLWDLLHRYPGKRGSRNLRFALQRITEEPSGRKRSKLEERFAPFLCRHHLPLPRFNDWILLDRSRDRALHVAGYPVIHLTWAQLDSEPAQVAADLRKLLGRAAATSTCRSGG
jgi:hypothetical protein